MTTTELAEKTKTTAPSISRYERGKRTPSATTAIKLARALGCTVEELMGEDAPQKQDGKEG